MINNKLNQLKQWTTVVADTGDIESIQAYQPEDTTTNPTLLLKATKMSIYSHLVENAIKWGNQQKGNDAEKVIYILDKLAVNFGIALLEIIPGRVSTEIDARFAFDTQESIQKAKRLIELYEAEGISRNRVLIKIPATWEGIQAARVLEQKNIQCNLTLLFSFAQAVACAEAGVFLISPFVGRILDWYQIKENKQYSPSEDPGVYSVKQIYNYYKKFKYPTIVMGASFRSTEQIEELAGCDRLTISPKLLNQLQNSEGVLQRKLEPTYSEQKDIQKIQINEMLFRWMLNEDAMATEKLAEGIRNFHKDWLALKQFIEQKKNHLL